MTTDNKLINFGQMTSDSHIVTVMHIFVTLCPIYESLMVIFVIDIHMSAL